jgi:hypothetical protein
MIQVPPDAPRFPRCAGLPPGAPCPAHDDNSWPEGCDCYMSHQPDNDWNDSVATALLVCALSAIAIVAFTWIALGADNEPACMTKEQARAAHPGQWLYWRTSKRCWYGQGRATLKSQPQSRSVRPTVKSVRWNEFNELDAAADRDTYFEPEPAPIWRLIPIPHPRFVPWDERIGL